MEEQSLRSLRTVLGYRAGAVEAEAVFKLNLERKDHRTKRAVYLALAEVGSRRAWRHVFTFAVNGTNSQVFAESSTTGFRSKTDLTLDGTFEVLMFECKVTYLKI